MSPEMSWDARRPPDVVKAIHPETLIHPVIQEARGTHGLGVMTATQWYLLDVLIGISDDVKVNLLATSGGVG